MSSSITTPTKPANPLLKQLGTAAHELDERYRVANGLKRQLKKVFPSHWWFMLGEIALYSFIVLLLSGVYLALFFDPSMTEVTYNGSFANLRGVSMSEAYASTLNISFDVRGGLFIRQVHHWAALLFMSAIVVHMMRIFFTGAFRKPRRRTGSSACCCSCWAPWRASSATHCRTTCCPAPACGSCPA